MGLAFSLEPPRSVISLLPDIHVNGCVSVGTSGIHILLHGPWHIMHSRLANMSLVSAEQVMANMSPTRSMEGKYAVY